MAVRRNKGCAGVDKIDFKRFDKRVQDILYRLWNRMSSGSYMPEPVLQVEIPKSNGGKRPLGIPTILDRIAQMTVVMQITPRLEAIFHTDSYGYRPAKSAHDAISKARERCFKYGWVLDMDISKFFDTIDHELLMKAVEWKVQERWILLYVERWLKVPYQTKDGEQIERTMGVPQGSLQAKRPKVERSDRASAGEPVPALRVRQVDGDELPRSSLRAVCRRHHLPFSDEGGGGAYEGSDYAAFL